MPGPADIRAGGAFVELYAKDNRLVKGLAAASGKLKAWGQSISSIGTKLAAVGGAIVAPLTAAATVFAETGSSLYKMSQRTGIAVEALSALQYAAGSLDPETLETGVRKMQKSIVALASGSEGARDAFDRLGITIGDLAGLTPDEQLLRIADGLAQIHDPAIKAATAMEIFGKTGTQLLPLVGQGAGAIRQKMQEAAAQGLTWTKDEAASAAQLARVWGVLAKSTKRATESLGAAAAPLLQKTAQQITRLVQLATDWIKQNQGVVAALFEVAKIAVVAGTGIYFLGKAVSFVGTVVGVLGTVISTAGAVVGKLIGLIAALVSPLGLVVAAVGGAVAAWALFTDSGKAAMSAIGQAAGNVKEICLEAFGGIKDALAAGDWQLAAQIAVTGVKLAWEAGIDGLIQAWREFRDFFVDLFRGMVTTAAKYINSFVGWVKKAWKNVSDAFADLGDGVEMMLGDDSASNAAAQRIVDRERKRKDYSLEIDRETEASRKALDQEFERGMAQRARQRETSQKQEQDRLWQLRDEFSALRQTAADKAKGPQPGTPEFYAAEAAANKKPDIVGADELEALAKKQFSTAGTFSAAVAPMLAGPTNLQRGQLDALKRIDDHLLRLLREAQHGKLVFA